MPSLARKFRIFVGSPGDVQRERTALAEVIAHLNLTIGTEADIVLELVRWETHAFPSAGRAQAVINEQLGDYDIFVGIMWERFGSPTGAAESGTEEEFMRAFEAWQGRGAPHIAFYFRKERAGATRRKATSAQLARVKAFRSLVAGKALICDYSTVAEFRQLVTHDLFKIISLLRHAEDNISVQVSKRTIWFRTRIITFSLKGHTIEVRLEPAGREIVFYDGKEVSREFSFVGTHHSFVVNENGRTKYDVDINATIRLEYPLLVPSVTLRRDGEILYSDK